MADYDEILHKYWYTEISESYSDISQSQGTDDQVIDIVMIFTRSMMKEVLSYGTSAYNKTSYHMSALIGKMWVLELLHTIQNKTETNLEFINMFFSAFAATYDGMGTRILNLSHWKNS